MCCNTDIKTPSQILDESIDSSDIQIKTIDYYKCHFRDKINTKTHIKHNTEKHVKFYIRRDLRIK